jgi:hypothetical protein
MLGAYLTHSDIEEIFDIPITPRDKRILLCIYAIMIICIIICVVNLAIIANF